MSVPWLVRPSEPKVAVDAIVFDAAAIARRVEDISGRIVGDYAQENLLLVGILKGAYLFTCDLLRRLSPAVRAEFITLSRYRRPGMRRVRVTHDLRGDIRGRDVLVVEDSVDTGLSLHYLIGLLEKRGASSVNVCTLLDRPKLRLVDLPLRYVGFEVNEEFLIGYGLDYREQFRQLPYIATMKRIGVRKKGKKGDSLLNAPIKGC